MEYQVQVLATGHQGICQSGFWACVTLLTKSIPHTPAHSIISPPLSQNQFDLLHKLLFCAYHSPPFLIYKLYFLYLPDLYHSSMAVFTKFCVISLIIALSFASLASGETETKNPSPPPPPQCGADTGLGCRNKAAALKLKIIAIAAILVTSMVGVCTPLFSRMIPAVQPDTDLFALVKAFASGVILATGYMHVMPDSFDCLRSACLPENPWKKFPFTTFVAMLSAILTLMVDSFAMSLYKKHKMACPADDINGKEESQQDFHHHEHAAAVDGSSATQLLRYRVVAQAGINTILLTIY